MKKHLFPLFFGILFLFSVCFSSCRANQRMFVDDPDASASSISYAALIKNLESQIAQLKQDHALSNSENQEEILRLQNLLAELKKEASEALSETNGETESNTEQDRETESSPLASRFLYTPNGPNATITGYVGNDEVLVIPSKIDGYVVTAIGDNAFQSSRVKTIVVADGVTKIGWFAFRDCPALCSVTLPSSVSVIGYAAFPSENDHLTVYCPSGSFAQQYAQSYGIRYAII